MGQGSTHGPIDIGKVQSIVDGTLCRAPSWQPGPLDVFAAGPQAAIFFGERYFYCEVWSEGDRTAFWRGVGDRVVEYGEQAWAVIVWLRDAFGLGDDGGFANAWSELGHALVSMAHLNFKLMVVLGIPPILSLHPSRQAYQDELFDLGVHIAKDAVEGYRKAYSAGGLPQCTGRLFVDILVLVIEALATKGAGKLLESTKLARLTRFIPEKMVKAVPDANKAERLFEGLTDAEIDAAVEQAFSPHVTGGKKPKIDGHRISTKRRNLLDIDDISLEPGETTRQALTRVRKVIGRKISDLPSSVRDCWNNARSSVLAKKPLTATNYKGVYDDVREAFWKNVRADSNASRYFRESGFDFPAGNTTAPHLRVTNKNLSVEEIRVSLDHVKEKAIGDNWKLAVDADNLEMTLQNPNAHREIVQMRHPELRP